MIDSSSAQRRMARHASRRVALVPHPDGRNVSRRVPERQYILNEYVLIILAAQVPSILAGNSLRVAVPIGSPAAGRAADASEPPPLLNPSLAEVCRSNMASLSAALGREDTHAEAAEVIRSLVNGIDLTHQDGQVAIVLRGDLAAMLAVAANSKKPGALVGGAGLLDGVISLESLVAGIGFGRQSWPILVDC